MKISKIKFKNNSADYAILIGSGAIKLLKKQIYTICPNTKKIAIIFDRKIPLKLKANLRVGSITVELDEFKGPKNPFDIVIN